LTGHAAGSDYIRACLRGIDFNPDLAQSARIRLAFEGGSGDEVLCGNALGEFDDLLGTFDCLLTNPPFGSKGKITDAGLLARYELGIRPRARGLKLPPAQTPEILFIERSLALLRPGGRMAIVLPDGLLQNSSCRYLREWLRCAADVLAVISLPQETFVPFGTGVKTSLLLLRKRETAGGSTPKGCEIHEHPVDANDPGSGQSPCGFHAGVDRCFMARMRRLGYDARGQPVYRRDSDGNLMHTADGSPQVDCDVDEIVAAWQSFADGRFCDVADELFALPRGELNSRLDVEHYLPHDRRLIAWLQACGARPLGELADILTRAARLKSGEEIRYIAISDIHAATMQVVSHQVLPAHEAPLRARYRVQAGDILTAVSGASTGTARHAAALIAEEDQGAICSSGLAVLRNIRGVDPLYLLSYLRTEPFLRQVRRLMTGHAIPAISLEDLAGVLVPLLSAGEQADIARRVRRLHALQRRMQRRGKGLMSHIARRLEGWDSSRGRND
jgi:type I restriction enzyme M protein